MVDLNKINWTCDCCGAYLNSQEGFNTESDWVCTVCGFVNDVSLGNIKWRPGDLKAMDEEDRNEVLEAKKVFRKRKRDGYFDQPLYDEDETYDTEAIPIVDKDGIACGVMEKPAVQRYLRSQVLALQKKLASLG